MTRQPDRRIDRNGRSVWALLIAFAAVLCLAGGASRADVSGQVITRLGAWTILVAALFLLPMPRLRAVMPVALLVVAAVALPLLQLIPLPPALWEALPGRQLLVETGRIAGLDDPWRPLSIAPGETINALGSLIVPVVALILVGSVPVERQPRIVTGLLAIIVFSCIIGAAEFSGAGFDHPFVNDVPGEVSGLFANRNHFALFAVLGCAIAPYVAFSTSRALRTALTITVGAEILCILVILAIGSRAGILLAPAGVVLGFAVIAPEARSAMNRSKGRANMAFLAGAAGLVIAVIAAAVLAGRSVSLNRFISEGAAAGLRGKIRPTIDRLVETYFPFGTGFGSFDPAFRIHEPMDILTPLYVNAAHNDFYQVVIEGGAPGAALLACAIAWWGLVSWKAWRNRDAALARLGSSVLALIAAASVVDYPARTPIIMAVLVTAALWLLHVPAKRLETAGI